MEQGLAKALRIIDIKMREFGVPLKEPDFGDIPDYSRKFAKHFVVRGGNLLVIGENHYKKCIKLAYLHWIKNRLDMRWFSHSQISPKDLELITPVLILVQLHTEPSDYKINWPAAMVSKNIRQQVLLGCNSVEELENAFPNDLDMIEYNFEIWKEK